MDPDTIWNAYCGAAPTPADIVLRWNLEPYLLSILSIAFFAYGWMTYSGRWLFHSSAAGFAFFAIAFALFISPFCALTSALFSARIGHHLILTTLLAPLLVMTFRVKPVSSQLGLVASLFYAIVLWLWHTPALYDGTFVDPLIYWMMQISLFATATVLWTAIRGLPPEIAILALAITTIQMSLLGALLTMAPHAIYAPHALTTEIWGLSALSDQQLGGGLMWVAGGGTYLAAALHAAQKLINRNRRIPLC